MSAKEVSSNLKLRRQMVGDAPFSLAQFESPEPVVLVRRKGLVNGLVLQGHSEHVVCGVPPGSDISGNEALIEFVDLAKRLPRWAQNGT